MPTPSWAVVFDVCSTFIMVDTMSTRRLHTTTDIFAGRPPKHTCMLVFCSPCYSEDGGCSGSRTEARKPDFHHPTSRCRKHDVFFCRYDMVRKWEFLENFLLSENKAIVQCTNLRGAESVSSIGISMKSCFEGVLDFRKLVY